MGRRQLPRRGARAVQPPPAIPEVSASRRPAPGPSDHGSPPTADDLLLQIRERHGSPPTPSPPASKAEEPRPSDDAIEVTLTGDDDDDCATVMMTPEQLKAKLAEEFLDATPSRPPVTQSVRSVGDAGPVEVHLEGPDGPCRISVPGGITVGEALSRAIGSGLVLPTDQTGTIRGWYRARVGAEAIDPSDDVSVLAQPGAQAVLVVSRTRTVDLVVRAAGKELRFSTPMNTTVPVQSLIKHLVEWLAVGRGDWRLLHQGRPLSSHAILADIDGNDTLTLEFSVGTA